jgi:hypothetical protein
MADMPNYLIFARKAYQQPLEWIGQLATESGTPAADAETAELARLAREQFGAEGWVEMVAIPASAVVRVIPMD